MKEQQFTRATTFHNLVDIPSRPHALSNDGVFITLLNLLFDIWVILKECWVDFTYYKKSLLKGGN